MKVNKNNKYGTFKNIDPNHQDIGNSMITIPINIEENEMIISEFIGTAKHTSKNIEFELHSLGLNRNGMMVKNRSNGKTYSLTWKQFLSGISSLLEKGDEN